VRGFKVSRDPKFVEKLEDIVGLYMSPPEHPKFNTALSIRARLSSKKFIGDADLGSATLEA
jgi:hypothetical protein